MNQTSVASFFFAAVLLLVSTAFATPVDRVQLIKISSQDSKAVIRAVDGKIQVIKPGDSVAENVTVKEIIPGRVILEEKTGKGLETLIVRIDNGKTRIERIRMMPENRPIAPTAGVGK